MPDARTPAPAPGGLPVLGHTHQLLRHRLEFLQHVRAHGDVVSVRAGRQRMYVVNDPWLIREVLTRRSADYHLSPQFRVMRRIIGNGLLATDGAFHRRQRRLVLPAMHHSRVRAYAEEMGTLARERTSTWRDGQTVQPDREFSALAAEIAVRCLFSAGIDDRRLSQVVHGIPLLMSWAGSRGLDPTGVLARLPSPLNSRFRRTMRALDGIVGSIIAERRRGAAPSEDVLSMLLNAVDADTGTRMPEQQVHDETMTFLIAGTESVSGTLAWCVYLLGRNPRTLARLYDEVDEVLGGRAPTVEQLPRLALTSRVLHETLRLYPPAYLVSRAARVDTVIGRYRIPAGSTVLFSYYATQRDPGLFEDPLCFDPDRWRVDNGGRVTRDAFVPFGLGPHGCLGEDFAWTEMTIVLASVVSRWRLEPLSLRPMEPVPAFSLVPGRMRVRVSRRTCDVHG